MKKSLTFLSVIVILCLLSAVVYLNFFLQDTELVPVMFMMIIILIICLFLLFAFMAKAVQRSEIYEKVVSEKPEDKDQLYNEYPAEIVEKYKDYIFELEKYVKKHKAKGRELNEIYLKDAGWNEEIIELVLDKEFGSQKIEE